ncbi:MAG: DUF4179 domain-containing protein [Methanomicrobiales archaeon]|nr:DUF4179 domain-containing protein [Methanomicrobiales archaeon]
MELGPNRNRDWIAWTAVAITVWLVMSIFVSLANPVVARWIWPGLFPVFILAYGYLTAFYLVKRVKGWSEKYLDTLLEQQTFGNEGETQRIQAMVEHVGEMEKKVDRIKTMLVMDKDRGSRIEMQEGISANPSLSERTHESLIRGLPNDSL